MFFRPLLMVALVLASAAGSPPARAQSERATPPPATDPGDIDDPNFRALIKDIDKLRGSVEALSPSQKALDLLKGADVAPTPDLTILLFAEAGRWTAKVSDHDGVAVSGVEVSGGAVVLPLGAAIDLRAVSADLLYEMRFPELGLAFDAIPGRIGATSFVATTTGEFQGVCSLCGAEGAPLLLRVVEKPQFDAWIASRRGARE